jgi:hypothetical protein
MSAWRWARATTWAARIRRRRAAPAEVVKPLARNGVAVYPQRGADKQATICKLLHGCRRCRQHEQQRGVRDFPARRNC